MTWAILAHPDKSGLTEPLCQAVSFLLERGENIHMPSSLYGLIESGPVHSSANEPLHRKNLLAGITFCHDEHQTVQNSDMVLVIGGDGTMLHSAQQVKDLNIPILGINTGRLGFMANVQPQEIREAIGQVLTGTYEIDRRIMLSATFSSGENESTLTRTFHALNEHLFYKKGHVSLITVAVHLDGQLLNRYLADGLIITTPTGSTAYNLSAGGPIVMPGTRVMVVTPVSPHTLTTRPIVVPLQSKLQITIEESAEDTLYAYDGVQVPIGRTPVIAVVTASHHEVQLVRLPHQTYFQTLQNKLMWGLDRREKTK